MHDDLTGINSHFTLNGMYLPDGAHFKCPLCGKESDLHETDRWELCGSCGAVLIIKVVAPKPENTFTIRPTGDLKNYVIKGC